MRAEEPLAEQQQQAGVGAAAAAAAAAPAGKVPSFVPRTSLERIRHGLNAIFSAMHAPHGSRQEQMVRGLHEARDERRVLTTERLLQELCGELNCTMEQLQEHEEMLGGCRAAGHVLWCGAGWCAAQQSAGSSFSMGF